MRTQTEKSIEERIDRLHAGEIVDFHFDLLIDLYEKRDRPGALVSHFFPEFEVGDIGVLGMKMNTLEKAYDALLNMEPEITLPESVRKRAEIPILRMLELSK